MDGKRAKAAPPRYENRCLVCGTPLSGFLGRLVRFLGIRRSARNPNLCTRCNTHVDEGHVVEMTVLFADLSSFTALTNRLGPERSHEVVDAFLQAASRVLVAHDAFIDKYVGDAVMALFNVPIRRPDHGAQAVAAACDIQALMPELAARFGLELRSSVGIAEGWARVGRLGSADGKDYTAIGNVVNLAARLVAAAGPDEVLVDRMVYRRVSQDFPSVRSESLALKGFPEPVEAYRLRATGDGPSHRHVRPMDGHWAARLGTVVFAVLGAPCAAVVLLSPLAPILGLGAVLGVVVTTVVPVLDQGLLRIPLLLAAILLAAANLYTVRHARVIRRRAAQEGRPMAMTALERRRTIVAVAASLAALLLVALELYGHHRYHDSLLA